MLAHDVCHRNTKDNLTKNQMTAVGMKSCGKFDDSTSHALLSPSVPHPPGNAAAREVGVLGLLGGLCEERHYIFVGIFWIG